MRIVLADFGDPRLALFLQAHLDDIAPTAPKESQHALNVAELQSTMVRLFVTYIDDDIVATGALARLDSDGEELKSMRTAPARRRQGLASAMLRHLLDDARSRGVRRVSLETGSMDFFVASRALYADAGFTVCAPFGSYVIDPNSTYMTLEL